MLFQLVHGQAIQIMVTLTSRAFDHHIVYPNACPQTVNAQKRIGQTRRAESPLFDDDINPSLFLFLVLAPRVDRRQSPIVWGRLRRESHCPAFCPPKAGRAEERYQILSSCTKTTLSLSQLSLCPRYAVDIYKTNLPGSFSKANLIRARYSFALASSPDLAVTLKTLSPVVTPIAPGRTLAFGLVDFFGANISMISSFASSDARAMKRDWYCKLSLLRQLRLGRLRRGGTASPIARTTEPGSLFAPGRGPEAGILSASSFVIPFWCSRCSTEGYTFAVAEPSEAGFEDADDCVELCGVSLVSSWASGASCFADSPALALASSCGISRLLMSSPASAVTAILCPTFTPFVPSPCITLTKKDSPSFSFQFAMLPSVMVGDNAGMLKFCAASSRAETSPLLAAHLGAYLLTRRAESLAVPPMLAIAAQLISAKLREMVTAFPEILRGLRLQTSCTKRASSTTIFTFCSGSPEAPVWIATRGSPNHRSFAYFSWICGGMLMFGGYNWALLTTLEPPGDETNPKPKKSWLVKSTAMFVALFFTVLGTSVILAPAKTIRTISAQAASKTGHTKAMLLYCEIEGFLPFQKNRTIMATRPESLLDRRVSAQDIEFSSVPLSAVQAFTADPKPFAEPLIKPTGSMISRAWDDLRINTRRMFYRDGFAYIRFRDYGSYKIDLQNCELLDNGRALEHLTVPDPDKGVGAIALFRRKFLQLSVSYRPLYNRHFQRRIVTSTSLIFNLVNCRPSSSSSSSSTADLRLGVISISIHLPLSCRLTESMAPSRRDTSTLSPAPLVPLCFFRLISSSGSLPVTVDPHALTWLIPNSPNGPVLDPGEVFWESSSRIIQHPEHVLTCRKFVRVCMGVVASPFWGRKFMTSVLAEVDDIFVVVIRRIRARIRHIVVRALIRIVLRAASQTFWLIWLSSKARNMYLTVGRDRSEPFAIWREAQHTRAKLSSRRLSWKTFSAVLVDTASSLPSPETEALRTLSFVSNVSFATSFRGLSASSEESAPGSRAMRQIRTLFSHQQTSNLAFGALVT
ncbi:hypothetical protein KC325_g166 [Hortaea werneckii]|nr:hypothetical protein KC325_g166 [Hortaea werneckii]